ncbi:anaerobic sulfatase maturase [Desulfovibrio sp. OttesenSCG-928-M14]|nr:anaerobic sulfatase maturase [Desulfovibrio sp. OttesenSCG-928-M14]
MPFHMMIKPGGALCNMRCAYCFFLSKAETLGSRKRLAPDLLEAFIRQYIESQPDGPVVFTWQGGEPTLLGLDFFEMVVRLQQKHCPPGKSICNDLQTNGQLVDGAWCDFLKEYNWLVGLSIDGPQDLHDLYRSRNDGQGSFKAALHAAHLLGEHKIPFNTLTVLHHQNAKEPLRVYKFLRDEVGSVCMQFLPLVETVGHAHTAPAFWDVSRMPQIGSPEAMPGTPQSFVEPWCVEPLDYGRFMTTLFDYWKNHDMGRIILPFFDCMLSIWLGRPASMCVFGNVCGNQLALDSDGSIYFCDRFCYADYRLGKLDATQPGSLAAIAENSEVAWFGKMKGAVPKECRQCRWAFACKGECPKNRFLLSESGGLGLNYLCAGLKHIFAHIDGDMERMKNDYLSLQPRNIHESHE